MGTGEATKPQEVDSRNSRFNDALKMSRMTELVSLIERMAVLGARPNAIARILEADGISENTIRKISREYLGQTFGQGRRSTASPSEMGWGYALQAAIYYNIYVSIIAQGFKPPVAHVQAYEIYHFVSKNLEEARLSIEACFSIIDHIEFSTLIGVTCIQCGAPQLASNTIMRNRYVCSRCRQGKGGALADEPGKTDAESDAGPE